MPVWNSLTLLGELILISMFSLIFGNVRSLDGRNMERMWKSPANMGKTGCKGFERWYRDESIMFEGDTPCLFSHKRIYARQDDSIVDSKSSQS